MSLIVTVYVNEGIVMASDSRATLEVNSPMIGGVERQSFPLSDSTHKTFLCANGCGISTCGAADFSGQAIASYLERINESLIKPDTKISEMPQIILNYFNALDKTRNCIFHVCGYEKSADETMMKKIYRVYTGSNSCIIDSNQDQESGAIWDGQREIMTRLIKKQIVNPKFVEIENFNVNEENYKIHMDQAIVIDKTSLMIYPEADIAWEYMSLQDAVNFAKFAIETTVKAMDFRKVSKTVGGPIDILVLKPKESKWLKHKKLSA